MSNRPRYRDECIRLLEQGLGVRQIARQVGCSATTVMKYKRWAKIPEPGALVEPVVPGELKGSARGRELLWAIASDPSAPQSSRVQAVDKLREVEEWGASVTERRLPPPLNRDELVERQLVLLESLEAGVLAEVLERAKGFIRASGT